MLLPPSPARQEALFECWSSQSHSHPAEGIGLTRHGHALPGYTVDHNRQLLGRGQAMFNRAIAALWGWHMFKLPWLMLLGAGTIEAGRTVAVMQRRFARDNKAAMLRAVAKAGTITRLCHPVHPPPPNRMQQLFQRTV